MDEAKKSMKTILDWAGYLLSWTFVSNLPLFIYQEIYRALTGRMIIHETVHTWSFEAKSFGVLYQSSRFSEKDIPTLRRLGITAIIDLEGEPDDLRSLVTEDNFCYWPIKDEPRLPNLARLKEVAQWGFNKLRNGGIVVVHCAAGHNRSGLVCARILVLKGHTGQEAVKIIQKKVPGGLVNFVFRDYILTLDAGK